jgi:hypothetical protein
MVVDMTKIKEMIFMERLQFLVIIAFSIGMTGLAGILYFHNASLFYRILGNVDPLASYVAVSVLGVLLLAFLLSRGWFAIYKKENLKGLARSSALAALLGVIMILVDTQVVFPADFNIPFPESLLFYPAMDFFAQILFHVLPLSVLLISLTLIFRNTSQKHIVWICILVVALLDPAYQTVVGFQSPIPFWAVVYVCIHVFIINLAELIIFKRYDFISMYAFRLVYYLFWHIGWGYFRLQILF